MTTILIAGSAETTNHGAAAVRAAGGLPVPAVVFTRTAVISDETAVAAANLAAGRYGWLAVTSQATWQVVRTWDLAGTQIAAVGAATASAIRRDGLQPFVPHTPGGADALIRPLAERAAGTTVLFPHGDLAADTLATGLRELGVETDAVTVYRTEPATDLPNTVREAWPTVEYIIITSPSAARAMVGLLGRPAPDVKVACLGPTTAAGAQAAGLQVDRVGDSDLASLVSILLNSVEDPR